MNLADHLPDGSIVTQARAADWREAVRLAGDALVATGVTTPAYTDAMIATVDDLGPYIVIAPGFALAHARPSEAVLRTGLSWVHLAEPVEFGSEDNDPVQLVVGLAATDATSHVGIMSALAEILIDDDTFAAALAADTPAAVQSLLTQAASQSEGS